jgi:hypothetical protein
MHKLLFSIVFGALFTLTGAAQIGGTAIYSFLGTPIAPRVAGAAANVLANTEDDVTFALWNPALINSAMHGQMSLNVAPLADGVLFGEATYSHTFEKAGSFVAGVKYVDYGSFLRTTTQAQVVGGFTAADYAFQLGYGYHIDSNWQVGASLKIINGTYASFVSWAWATDLAAVYQIPNSRLAMTLVLANLGTQLTTFSGDFEPLPLNVKFAISSRFKHVPLRLNLMLDNLQQFNLQYNNPNNITRDPITGEEVIVKEGIVNNIMRHVTLAAEIAPSKNFNIQLGYSFRRGFEMELPTRRSSAGLTFGIGFRVSKFRINYANTNMNIAGRMHHFGITTSLGNFKNKNK